MSGVNPSIFREYDVRGVSDTDLNNETVTLLGKAFAVMAKSRGAKNVVIGRDIRPSGERLLNALSAGLMESGLDVIDAGVIPTPVLYFAEFHIAGAGASIQITGSHNPPEYNGFKMSIGREALHGDEIRELYNIIQRGKFESGQGKTGRRDALKPYEQYLLENIRPGARKLRVVVDAGNATGAINGPDIYEKLGFSVDRLFCDLDPTFPNHHPDPTVLKNLEDLIRRVRETRADLGIAFDGDADRIGVVDETGGVIWGDRLMIILARDILREKPGATIVSEVKCSQTLFDDIEKHGGKAIMWKTGHSPIKAKMRETGAELAGEMSGHIFYKNRYHGFDDAIYTGARLLEILSQANGPLSSLLADVPRTWSTPEIRVDIPEEKKFGVVAQALAEFRAAGHKLIDVDGVRVVWPDGWGLIRASNTQPVLVVRCEAQSESRLAEIRQTIENTLQRLMATA
ncbi:MAG: Phosphomannomutase/phosphoglucomutase [Myxococcota bacterium]|nr:Phosphomannomutase/phosphoglucomutase [Myxococcota bacterium]